MKIRMELAPDEPVVVVVDVPDDKVTPEMLAKIEALGNEAPFDTDDLPFGLDGQINWDDALNVHWCVNAIEIKKRSPRYQPDKHGELMKPFDVTITGADDSVDPHDLLELYEEFRFVEWGVLMAETGEGTARYPTRSWVEQVCRLPSLKLSAHLCGTLSAIVGYGKTPQMENSFSRVQLNGWDFTGGLASSGLATRLSTQRPEWIIHACSQDGLLKSVITALTLNYRSGSSKVSVIYDESYGRGMMPRTWPRAPLGARVGYAGGITPENVCSVLDQICAANPDDERSFWIDVESGVRDESDRLDLGKVRSVLEQVKIFNERLSSNSRG